MRRFPEAGVKTLGVCLGHQSMGQAFGGRVIRHQPVHGKTTEITHDGKGIFAGLPDPLPVARYHSLVVHEDLPDELEATAHGGGVLMAMRHRTLPAIGVQFHPESVLTPDGKQLRGTSSVIVTRTRADRSWPHRSSLAAADAACILVVRGWRPPPASEAVASPQGETAGERGPRASVLELGRADA